MLYVRRMSHPVMMYHASKMASKVNELRRHHLKYLHALLRHDKKCIPTLCFKTPSPKAPFSLEATSDASISSAAEGGERGAFLITRRRGNMVHPIHWNARKLRRVAWNSATAELLAASDAVSTLVYMKTLMGELKYHHDAPMFVYARVLANLATSIKEPAEAANKLDLAFLRERFVPDAISSFGWVPGYANITDGITKENRTTSALLIGVFRDGLHPRHPDVVIYAAEPPLIGDPPRQTVANNSDEFDAETALVQIIASGGSDEDGRLKSQGRAWDGDACGNADKMSRV